MLVVCTGNVCRSPYVAARLRQELPDLHVVSAGTGALRGRAPTEPVLDVLRRRGVDRYPDTARQLVRAHVRGARLVLTAQHAHRAEVARLVPPAAGRAFTVLELARLVTSAGLAPGAGLDAVVAGAGALAAHDLRDDDDLADPYRGSEADYAAMVERVESALDVLVPVLRGPS